MQLKHTDDDDMWQHTDDDTAEMKADGWHQTKRGGWMCDGVVLFEKPEGWGIAHEGAFSRARYPSAALAATALEAGKVTWIVPGAWTRTKDRTGWYRHDKKRGVLSVKKARSGMWYWTDGGAANGWFAAAETAMREADGAPPMTDNAEIEALLDQL